MRTFSFYFLYCIFIITLAMTAASCYAPPQHIILDAADSSNDSTAQHISRPYGIGYNMLVISDSLLLVEDRPMHWSEGVTESSDSVWLTQHDRMVIAALTVIPEDSIDSIWVKVARDQLTMGWIHEKDLLQATTPDDPISQFIQFFSRSHVLWFLIVTAVAAALALGHLLRRKRFRMIHLDDITSPYPPILTSTLALSAFLYALIQHYEPHIWVQFYFHPTLNPFSQPLLLCSFLCTVWALALLSLAVLDDVQRMLPADEAILYLLSLTAVCMILYLIISLTPIGLAFLLSAAYIAFAFYRYYAYARPRYLCGRCHTKLRNKGRCPRCGAIND